MSTSTTTVSVNCRNENELANLKQAVSELVESFGVQGLINLANKAKDDVLVRTGMKTMVATAIVANKLNSGRPFQLALPLPAATSQRAAQLLTDTLDTMLKEYGGAKGMMLLHQKLTTDPNLLREMRLIAAG